ncbi:uncharacterized protein [Physcomitrium patens]|uniref:Uncharacterized protein n=1 Tax=Physcomitrium patens TaxID=3218 RepID=A0A2K1JZK0_PHYPA|nr:uncharacterized protein LOC112288006 isoform X2 [Physcomitrium patens]PNR46951.1 hypothetical protein PHYPA_014071 [Physcomitrium patens]|eukprot:XP_024387509.1 uncharacterized protein LOC112288006 isoform X2 [Physcomitrella patens]
MQSIKSWVHPVGMSGGLSWAGGSIQAASNPRSFFFRQSGICGFLRSGFVAIGYQCLRRGPRTLHFSSVQSRACIEARVLSPAQEWVGLPEWRTNPVNELRLWGKRGPTSSRNEWEDITKLAAKTANAGQVLQLHREKLENSEAKVDGLNSEKRDLSLAEWGAIVLGTADPVEKAVFTHHAYRLWCNGELPLGVAEAPDSPARPNKPELVHPRKIPPPSGTILTPSAHALHNLAHIELNAIDLAWDTVVRFSGASEELDRQFFADFVHVADDESRHFLWCSQRLAEMGFSYGDMPAHNLLMVDCQRTSGSVMSRLAIIPMMQEARGLDAGPRLFDRLMGNGDTRSASITKRIAEEEVGHVAVGVAWFIDVCRRLGLNPADRFQGLLKEDDLELRGPFNHSARILAGLPRDWYDSSFDPDSPPEDFVPVNPVGSKGVRRNRVQVIKKKVLSPNERREDGESITDSSENVCSRMSEVYGRLAMVVAMEQDNAET